MTDRARPTGDDRSQDTPTDGVRRREFVALGVGASATLLAGCAGDGTTTPPSDADGSDGSRTLTGGFRLLISDAPADIADFAELNVTLDEARIFGTQGDDEDGEENLTNETDSEEGDSLNETDSEEGDSLNETDSEEGDSPDDEDEEDEQDDDGEAEDDEDDAERGFVVVDLDDATVDLTQVIEEDAMAVFDGEIPAGSYEKVELEVSDVGGIVDGEAVEVKLPSEKLQITNGFEVTPDEPVDFVFDINVVKRGPNGYILRPVVSGSGVAGRDVDVNEIDGEADDAGDDGGDGSDGGDDGDNADGGEVDQEGTDDAGNGTVTEN